MASFCSAKKIEQPTSVNDLNSAVRDIKYNLDRAEALQMITKEEKANILSSKDLCQAKELSYKLMGAGELVDAILKSKAAGIAETNFKFQLQQSSFEFRAGFPARYALAFTREDPKKLYNGIPSFQAADGQLSLLEIARKYR